jgi:HK97 family phage prohead protease
MPILLSADRWREAAQSAQPEAGLRKEFVAEVKADDLAEQRQLTFTISTGAVDRQSDTVAVDGWEIDNYLKNPVVLWGHDYSALPIGRAIKVWSGDRALRAVMEPTPKGMVRFNDIVFDLFKGGFLNAVSVGFRPTEWKWSDDKERPMGIDFKRQELLEFSAVTVPANAEALIEARGAGIDIDPLVEHAFEVIRRCVKPADIREFEKFLRDSGFPKSEAITIASRGFRHRSESGAGAASKEQDNDLASVLIALECARAAAR